MHHSAHYGADAGKGFEDVADQRQHQIDIALDLVAGQIKETLHVHLPGRGFVQRAQFLDQVKTQIALNQNVSAGADRGQRPEHRFAGITLDNSGSLLAAMLGDRSVQFLLSQHEH